jgi:NADH-quinone oxidoreductase subunit I
MQNIFREIAESAVAIAKGFTVTFKQMLGPTVTENYPARKPIADDKMSLAYARVDGGGRVSGEEDGITFEGRYRGVHVLRRDENGLEKCVACFLCAAACPSNCIYIEAAENTGDHRISAAERYAKVYNIDYNRCIFCGYCVEACPCDAITHGQGFEIAAYDTNALVWRKEQMLEPVPASAAKPR